MSLSINNNSSSLVALESLNAAQAELSKTENTVSTGKKVDNAADNPAVYAIAAQMNGNLQGMGAVSDSLSLGAQVVATANTAGKKIMDSLQTLQGVITTAGQTGTDASAMATQILSTLDSVNSYARNATFSGVNLLTSGSDAVNAYNGTTLNTLVNVQGQTQTFSTMAGSNATLVDKLGLTRDSAAGAKAADSTQNIFTSLTSANVSNISALNASDITLGDGAAKGTILTVGSKNFEFVQNGKSAQTGNIAVSLDTGFSTKTAESALVSAMNGAGVEASLNSDNSIAVAGASSSISMKSGDTFASLTLTADDQAKAVKLANSAAAVDTLKIGDTTYNFVKKGAKPAPALSGNTKNIELAEGATIADAMKAIVAQAGSGVTYDATKGVLTTGKDAITATFGNASPPLSPVAYKAAGTLVTGFTATAGKAADQIAVGLKGGVTNAVSALQSSITSMSSVMQGLGNYSNTLTGMTTYTKSLTDAVTNGVSALTDADMAAASAKLTSLQTKQSLAIKSLTIANGQSQNILSLFQG